MEEKSFKNIENLHMHFSVCVTFLFCQNPSNLGSTISKPCMYSIFFFFIY